MSTSKMNRRAFVKNGGMTLFGLGLVPGFLYRTARALPSGNRAKTLVAVFLRGGLDGLNAVVPFREKNYYSSRPTIAIPPPSSKKGGALDLNGAFGLHPAMQPLLDFYGRKSLAVIQAVGSPDPTRSHFDAQDFMESAAPGNKGVTDGWLNRYLLKSARSDATAFRGVSMSRSLPRSLQGQSGAIALGSIAGFDLRARRTEVKEHLEDGYRALYSNEADSLLSGTAEEMFDAVEFLKKADPQRYRPEPGVRYPNGQLGRNIAQLAQLLKAGLGIEVAFLDIGGWDHHVNEGGLEGQLAQQLGSVSQALSAFHRDLGPRMDEIVVLTMSEFGRTVRQNGNGGTDHGHANVMFALGGPVKGGQVYGRWPGLGRSRLFEGRDLNHTTDFRDIFAEVLMNHLECSNPADVFPNFQIDRRRFLNFISA